MFDFLHRVKTDEHRRTRREKKTGNCFRTEQKRKSLIFVNFSFFLYFFCSKINNSFESYGEVSATTKIFSVWDIYCSPIFGCSSLHLFDRQQLTSIGLLFGEIFSVAIKSKSCFTKVTADAFEVFWRVFFFIFRNGGWFSFAYGIQLVCLLWNVTAAGDIYFLWT